MHKHPSHDLDSNRIAERVRGILSMPDEGDWAQTAQRLGVSESALRQTIQPDGPQPSLAVLFAIVRHYAVDPTWLLTGEYDLSTHRAAVGDEPGDAVEVFRQVVGTVGAKPVTLTSITGELPIAEARIP